MRPDGGYRHGVRHLVRTWRAPLRRGGGGGDEKTSGRKGRSRTILWGRKAAGESEELAKFSPFIYDPVSVFRYVICLVCLLTFVGLPA